MSVGSPFATEDLWVEYPGSTGSVLALREVYLTVRDGEFVAIVGPSGCGKSTMVKVGCDLIQPTQGSVRIAGRTPEQARKEHKVGVVFQTPILLPWRTVLANTRLGLELVGNTGDARSPEEMLELVGLRDFAGAIPAELSGGMKQRVAIARALVLQPEVLLMDEPFGALDEFTRADLGQELLRIWTATHSTILFITHSVEEAVTLADRIVVLSARPGAVVGEVEVDIPRPRSPNVLELESAFLVGREVRRLLRVGTGTMAAPRSPSPSSESTTETVMGQSAGERRGRGAGD